MLRDICVREHPNVFWKYMIEHLAVVSILDLPDPE